MVIQSLVGPLGRLPVAGRYVGVCLLVACTCACADNTEPAAASPSDTTQGEEGPLDRAKSNIDGAHEDFKQAVRPAADTVDRKTQEVVDEGKRAAEKVVDSVRD